MAQAARIGNPITLVSYSILDDFSAIAPNLNGIEVGDRAILQPLRGVVRLGSCLGDKQYRRRGIQEVGHGVSQFVRLFGEGE